MEPQISKDRVESQIQVSPINHSKVPQQVAWNVGGFNPTHLKNIVVKSDHLPRFSGENNLSVWVATT